MVVVDVVVDVVEVVVLTQCSGSLYSFVQALPQIKRIEHPGDVSTLSIDISSKLLPESGSKHLHFPLSGVVN